MRSSYLDYSGSLSGQTIDISGVADFLVLTTLLLLEPDWAVRLMPQIYKLGKRERTTVIFV